jgi:hypothetical protein
VESNDQWNFVEVVQQACIEKFLIRGDFLICDNASVHHGSDSAETLDRILDLYGMLDLIN